MVVQLVAWTKLETKHTFFLSHPRNLFARDPFRVLVLRDLN